MHSKPTKTWIYTRNSDNSARFSLGIAGKNPIICIGLNPSKAYPGNLDPTLKSVERISKFNGYDSWVMINLYPLRRTNPDLLPLRKRKILHQENLDHIREVVSQFQAPIWAAWGNLIDSRKYFLPCLADIENEIKGTDAKWIKAGKLTVKNHPRHPLYLKTETPFSTFSLDEYLKLKGPGR